MNSWEFNSVANCVLRKSISSSLSILVIDVYKTVKTIDSTTSIIETHNGKKYKLVLEEI